MLKILNKQIIILYFNSTNSYKMKLKQLLLTKFLNKYTAKGQSATGLAEYVQKELDEMFVTEKFDERDLVKIDRRVRMFIKQQKMDSLTRTIDPKVNEKLTQQLSSNKGSVARQASVAEKQSVTQSSPRRLVNKD